jgi:hypothetical protein
LVVKLITKALTKLRGYGLALWLLLLGITPNAQASSAAFQFCDQAPSLTAPEQNTVFNFTSVVREELSKLNTNLTIISRSGLDLARFQIRYTHAAILWQGDTPNQWTARQLYYACEEKRPRLFDQGLAGFIMGTSSPYEGYISIVSLPPEASRQLRKSALDTPLALRMLAQNYSANAYPFSTLYQNCNQWVAELLFTAWGNTHTTDTSSPRQQAQQWLQSQQYSPSHIPIPNWMLMASAFVPLVHTQDHPDEDVRAHTLRVSLPSNIEQFIQTIYPKSQRIEICHNGKQAIVHQGWTPLKRCEAESTNDQIIPLHTRTTGAQKPIP